MSFFYIASPYASGEGISPEVRTNRFLDVECFLAQLTLAYIPCYSPVVHSHEMARRYCMPNEHGSFWGIQNEAMIDGCRALVVLKLEGWKESAGVAWEMAVAKDLGKPIVFYTMDQVEEAIAFLRFCSISHAHLFPTRKETIKDLEHTVESLLLELSVAIGECRSDYFTLGHYDRVSKKYGIKVADSRRNAALI